MANNMAQEEKTYCQPQNGILVSFPPHRLLTSAKRFEVRHRFWKTDLCGVCVLTLLLPWFGLASARFRLFWPGPLVHGWVGGWSRTSHNANLTLGGAIKSGAVAIRACLSIGRSVRRQHKMRHQVNSRVVGGWTMMLRPVAGWKAPFGGFVRSGSSR